MSLTTVWQISSTGESYSPQGLRVWSALEVRFGVWPAVPGHRAGAVWTVDDWRTIQWESAAWQMNIPNSFGSYDERWNVRAVFNSNRNNVRFLYALYVDDAEGQRVWDNNGGWNYETISP